MMRSARNQVSRRLRFIPLMMLPPDYFRYRQDVCFHEAGHALIFALLGLPIAGVYVCHEGGKVKPDHAAMRKWGEPAIDANIEMWEHCALMFSSALFAGVQAELIQRGIPVYGRLSLSDCDTKDAHEILADIFGCIDEPAWRAQRAANKILRKFWPAVCALANSLDARGALTNDEVLAALPDVLPSYAELMMFFPPAFITTGGSE